jgi:2-C-methyl-D-erythritol 2,4-cyclodiphosphate synthase
MLKPMKFRIGHGYDIHRLVPGRPLVLGGVTIPHPLGLEGHSDADCLLHALADAILGAMGLPDIGHYFPNTDPAFKNIDSAQIVSKAVAEAKLKGYVVENADTTLLAEAPKIGPHIPSMRQKIAGCLQVSEDAVGIKATTHEGQDSIGQKQSIAAHAVVLLRQKGAEE